MTNISSKLQLLELDGSLVASAPTRVVVVGSGVIGLTTALILARRGYQVEVIARDIPTLSSTSQSWSSPWAGANWCPFSADPRIARWETEGFERFSELIPTGIAMHLPIKRFASHESGLHGHWYKEVVPSYQILPHSECPSSSVGVTFSSLSVHAPRYMQWLESQARALGVNFTIKEVQSLEEIVADEVAVIVNATGLGARTLRPIEDPLVEPIRGQVVLVRAKDIRECVMDSSKSRENGGTRSTYIIPRPGGEEVVCGGCYEIGNSDLNPDLDLSTSILTECLALVPALSSNNGIDGIEVIRHCVGLRPSRKGGPRLEAERVTLGLGKEVEVVHAYGIGPAGFQASWGMAKEASDLVGEALMKRKVE